MISQQKNFEIIYGRKVGGDSNGIRALKKLDQSEAQVIFDYADEGKIANFEVDRTNYSLDRQGDIYKVMRRSTGWF